MAPNDCFLILIAFSVFRFLHLTVDTSSTCITKRRLKSFFPSTLTAYTAKCVTERTVR